MKTTFIRSISVPRVLLGCAVVIAGACPLGAATIDLTTNGSSGSATAAIGGTFQVQQINPQSTGTGVIDPFVRIQSNTTEMGFNTSLSPTLDAKAGTWTHALLLSDIPTVTLNSVAYRQFLLDVNQNSGGTNELLSLNQIQFFQSTGDLGASQSGLVPASATTPPVISFSGFGATEVFRMNNASSPYTEIRLNYELNAGSGSGDMFLYVPSALFTGGPSSYVTMFSQFGTPPGTVYSSNDGFEEWAVLKASTGVPDGGSTVLLLGGALIVLAGLSRRGLSFA